MRAAEGDEETLECRGGAVKLRYSYLKMETAPGEAGVIAGLHAGAENG
jgi:hypothetical protein